MGRGILGPVQKELGVMTRGKTLLAGWDEQDDTSRMRQAGWDKQNDARWRATGTSKMKQLINHQKMTDVLRLSGISC